MNINTEHNVEIISIGNELLIGKTLNTNAKWLAKHIAVLGGCVKRINIIGDNLDEISAAINESVKREPFLIITTGGLGPTFDDMTLEAIALSLKLPFNVNREALEMVSEKYRLHAAASGGKIELTPARIKMATLPQGAKPLRNPIGAAPGVLLKERKSTLIALPGVPREMKRIFEDSVEKIIRTTIGEIFVHEKSLYITGIMESTLAPLIDETMRTNPQVYIKSHPKLSETKPRIELHFMMRATSKEEVEKRIDDASTKLSQLILKHDGKIE